MTTKTFSRFLKDIKWLLVIFGICSVVWVLSHSLDNRKPLAADSLKIMPEDGSYRNP